MGRDLEIRLETILGLNSHQIREFTPQNIRVLNETLEDQDDPRYIEIESKDSFQNLPDLLKLLYQKSTELQ